MTAQAGVLSFVVESYTGILYSRTFRRAWNRTEARTKRADQGKSEQVKRWDEKRKGNGKRCLVVR